MDDSTRNERDAVTIAAAWRKLFGDVSADAIAEVNDRVDWIELHGGAFLMRQGDEADSAYVLVRGRLRAVVEGGEGGPRVVGEVSPGESVGEMALMTGQPRSASVYAIRDSLLASLSRASFESLIQSRPELVIGFSRILIRRLERSLHGREVPNEVRNVGILLPRPSPAAREFVDRLVATLENYGPTLLLDRAAVVELLRAQNIVADPDGDTDVDGLVAWLDEQERSHRFVVYVADPGATGWSRRSVRQADRVILVSRADEDPAPGEVEAEPARPSSSVTEPDRELVLLHDHGDTLPRDTRRWFEGRQLQRVHHVRLDRKGDVARVARFLAGRAIGFALAGGGAKGFAHLGAVRALREAGVPLDVLGGTSIGAILAAAIARDWDLDTLISNVREAFTRGNPLRDFAPLPLVSLMQGRRLEKRLERYFGDADIEDLWLPFLCVSSSLTRARAHVHRRGAAAKAIRASLSIPGVLPPVVYGNELHIDGGSMDNLPVDLLRRAGAGRVIAGDLIFEREYVLDYDRVPSVWSLLHDRYVTRRRRLKVPGIVNIMLNATVLGGRDKARLAAERADLRIPMEVQKIGLVDWKAFDRAIEIGYRQTVQALESSSDILEAWSVTKR